METDEPNLSEEKTLKSIFKKPGCMNALTNRSLRMKIYIYTALFVAYVLSLVAMPLFMVALGLDIHINHQHFAIAIVWMGFFLLIALAPAWILINLIRREIRRKRLAETPQ
jgi:hypothetical protein